MWLWDQLKLSPVVVVGIAGYPSAGHVLESSGYLLLSVSCLPSIEKVPQASAATAAIYAAFAEFVVASAVAALAVAFDILAVAVSIPLPWALSSVSEVGSSVTTWGVGLWDYSKLSLVSSSLLRASRECTLVLRFLAILAISVMAKDTTWHTSSDRWRDQPHIDQVLAGRWGETTTSRFPCTVFLGRRPGHHTPRKAWTGPANS